jgi:hypothetical protein
VLGYLNIMKRKRKAKVAAAAAAMEVEMRAGSVEEVDDAAAAGAAGVLPPEELRALLEETLALATAVGAATATGTGAGRNVATAAKVRELLDGCAASGGGQESCGYGVSAEAAVRAKTLLDATLTRRSERAAM